MRRFRWLLICCLALVGPRTFALEFFGDVLYWQATEPVDWCLTTNESTTDQWVAFNSVDYDSNTGFRAGVGSSSVHDWGAKLYYTRFYTETEDTAAGKVTPMFFGGRSAVPTLLDPPYFQSGRIEAAIDYNVVDLDFGKSFCPTEAVELRPVLGLRGAWINQTFDAEYQGEWWEDLIERTSDEQVKNNFWGIGPKLGVENALNLWSGEKCQIQLTLNFYTAYLLGYWSFGDRTIDRTTITDPITHVAHTSTSRFNVPMKDRQFGALTFQAMAGIHLQYRNWSATVGYEINDWLNQCQIFDDATGPHNNDLILQGLTIRVTCSF